MTAVEPEHWNRGVRENPEDRKAWMMLGRLLFDQGGEAEGLLALRRVKICMRLSRPAAG